MKDFFSRPYEFSFKDFLAAIASRKYISSIDASGDVFEYADEKDYGVYLGMNPIPVQLAKNIIEDIQFPLMWLNVPLFYCRFGLWCMRKAGQD